MKLRVDFSKLITLRDTMPAPLVERLVDSGLSPITDIENELITGVESDLDDIKWAGPFPTYRGLQALIYIKDTGQTLDHIRDNKHDAKKFHLVWCKTLKYMNKKKRFKERYVLTRKNDGTFLIDAYVNESRTRKIESDEQLYVCQNCLEEIGAIDYSTMPKESRRKIVEAFNIQDFLDEFQGDVRYLVLPDKTDKTAPCAEYTSEFCRKSKALKQREKYKCQECGVDLSDNKGLLHAHHIDHDKTNNRTSNLKAICLACHKENHHPEMYASPREMSIIQQLRNS